MGPDRMHLSHSLKMPGCDTLGVFRVNQWDVTGASGHGVFWIGELGLVSHGLTVWGLHWHNCKRLRSPPRQPGRPLKNGSGPLSR